MKHKNPYIVRQMGYTIGDKGDGGLGAFDNAKDAFDAGGKAAGTYRRVLVQQWAPNSSDHEQLYTLIAWKNGQIDPSACDWTSGDKETTNVD